MTDISSFKREKIKGKEMFFWFIVGLSLPAFTGLFPKLLETKHLESVKCNITYNEREDLFSQCFLWFFPPFYDN